MGSVATLEPAIPEHLRVERTVPAKTPPDFQPPFPAYSARFPVETKDLVMGIIGVQHSNRPESQSAEFKQLVGFLGEDAGQSKPRYWEAAAVTDNRDYYNEVVIPYWSSKQG